MRCRSNTSRAIDIHTVRRLSREIDPILFKKSYYLVPEETGAKAYALLRQALTEENKAGIAKVSFRDKEHLSALRVQGGRLRPRDDVLARRGPRSRSSTRCRG